MKIKKSKNPFLRLALAAVSAFCILHSALPALAQSPIYAPQTVGVPATIAAATTTNFATPLFIDARKQDKVAFQFRSIWGTAGESTGSTNVQFTLAPTVDGIAYDTNKAITLVSYNRAATAIFTNIETTNITASGLAGWFITKEVNNSAGGALTNTFQYGIKIGAP